MVSCYRWLPAQKALYVHLDRGNDHLVVLGAQAPTQPYLIRASSYVRDVVLKRKSGTLTMSGYGRKHLTLGKMKSNATYTITATIGDKTIHATAQSDAFGVLTWSGAINGQAVSVALTEVIR